MAFAAPRPSALAVIKEVMDTLISDLIDDDVLSSVIDELKVDQAPELRFVGSSCRCRQCQQSGLGGEGEGGGEGGGEEDLTPSEAEAAAEDAEGFVSEKQKRRMESGGRPGPALRDAARCGRLETYLRQEITFPPDDHVEDYSKQIIALALAEGG